MIPQWSLKQLSVNSNNNKTELWNFPIVFPQTNWGVIVNVSNTQTSFTLSAETQAVSAIADNSYNQRYYGKIVVFNRYSNTQLITVSMLTLGV